MRIPPLSPSHSPCGGGDPHFTDDKNERQPFVGTEVSVGLGSSEQKLELLESLQCLNITEFSEHPGG